MKRFITLLSIALVAWSCTGGKYGNGIDRAALVARNNPHVTAIDTMAALTVGNGGFAFTVDATGLQTFPELYANGISLGTMSDWGWHELPNVWNYQYDEILDADKLPVNDGGDAADWFAFNPHRLHLGLLGFEGMTAEDISGVDQTLDMWRGIIHSKFNHKGNPVSVETVCDPESDMIAASITSEENLPLMLRFPAPSFGEFDCGFMHNDAFGYHTDLTSQSKVALIRVRLHTSVYFVRVTLNGAYIRQPEEHGFEIVPQKKSWDVTVRFSHEPLTLVADNAKTVKSASEAHWSAWWDKGGVVDFSACTDSRAAELERRVVLSQYLLAVQCTGDAPVQNTGLTYNSHYGKADLQNLWWLEAPSALFGHPEALENILEWYGKVADKAEAASGREGKLGYRWMTYTGIDGIESPVTGCGATIWQQPQLLYFIELLKRSGIDAARYDGLMEGTARYMCDAFDNADDQLEKAYWYFGLKAADFSNSRLLYRAKSLCETIAPDATADALPDFKAFGMLPGSPVVDTLAMKAAPAELNVADASAWDIPAAAMCATRLGDAGKAVELLLADCSANKFLANGHNCQSEKYRCFLPGNGGLLAAVALMCAGWDGCETENPGFPKDGSWNIRWEGINPLP